MLELSTKFKRGELHNMKKAKKAIDRLINSQTKLLFPKITGKLSLVTCSNAAFQNLPDQTSSGRGHVIMVAGSGGKVAPLVWTSKKVRRVVGSMVVA